MRWQRNLRKVQSQGAFRAFLRAERRKYLVVPCVEDDARIEIIECEGNGLVFTKPADFKTDGEDGVGVALDIGTTTLAYALVDLKSGAEIKACGELNRQGIYGADVISRIASADKGNLSAMQRAVLMQTERKLREFMREYKTENIRRLAVCGNTTMLNIFLGKNISGIGRFPFVAEVLERSDFPSMKS